MQASSSHALYGYARVSTTLSRSRKAQHVDNQVARLRDAGVPPERIYADKVTGTRASRPGWDKLIAVLGPGDTLVFTRLDRIGRSLRNLVDVVELLGRRKVILKSLDQGEIDTSTPHGKLLFQIMSALAEWESAITRERTIEGLEAARERHGGKLPLRGPSITDDQIATASMLATSTSMSAQRIADAIGVSRATLYRHVPVGDLRSEAVAS
jgi:DNA invertase Pin-like site-specific DNA recombinase